MKRGCFLSLLILAAFFGGYWYLLHPHIEPPVLWWATGIASFFMWISFGALQTAVTSARDASRVSAEGSVGGYGGEQFEDGATVTVVGHIRAIGSALRAPFSGRPAVFYTYDIDHISQRSDDSTNVKDYSGFALTPSAIDSPHGSVRILGFPMLEQFPKEEFDTDEGRRNAAAYLESAPFKDMQGFHPTAIYNEIKELLTDDDGAILAAIVYFRTDIIRIVSGWARGLANAEARKDWKMTEDRDLSDKQLHEQIVAPGTQVCAIGRWSTAKHGLVPPAAGMIRLLQGDAPQVAKGLWGKVVSNTIGCIVVAAIVNGAIYTLLQVAAGKSKLFAETPVATHSIHGDELHEAVRSGNLATAEKLVSNGTGVDVRDSDGRTPLAQAENADMARWLIAHGADVNAARADDGQTVLMEQAAAGRADVVRVLVRAGAKLDAVSTKWHSTALMRALDAEHLDVARILTDAGAKDETVSESRGQALHENDPPVRACFAYVDAIQREDRDALVKLSTFKSFDDVDFKIWKSSRPVHPKMVSGYSTENAATIQLRGAIPSGVYETWTYQLVRQGDEWRVNGERWETRLSSNEM